MDLWKIIDNYELGLSELNCGCDKCGKELNYNNDKWYHLRRNSWDSNDYCFDCGVDSFFEKLVLIDRTNMTVKEKPLSWKCDSCEIMLGGGYKWYTDNKNIDVCMNCYDEPKENIFVLVDKDKFCVIDRVGPLVINNEAVINRRIPKQFENNATEERMEAYAECINDIAHVDKNYGSYKQWAMFSGPYDIPRNDMVTALLVNCGPDHNGQIASLVADNHGRVGINIIYNSIDEYLKEYNEWEQTKLNDKNSDSFDYENATLEELEAHEEKMDDDESNYKIMNECIEFSGYIRFKKNLDTYYG